ncbi:MAG: hypothetical protein QXU74_02300 [Candidatus Aenigmatarchaeota archaeon]
MKIFGKTLKEYLWPIKYYVLISILVVISQYYIGLPLSGRYPWFLNLTQALWALMIVLSVLKLVTNYNFNMKNVLFLGVLYSIIIHGLKAFFFRVFLFPYPEIETQPLFEYVFGRPMGRFLYGSFLVMFITIVSGIIFIGMRKKKILKEKSKKS